MPVLICRGLSGKSSYDLTVNTLAGEVAIFSSSDLSTLSPIPTTNTLAFLFRSREESSSRGVYGPWSVVCFPSVITITGYNAKKVTNTTNKQLRISEYND